MASALIVASLSAGCASQRDLQNLEADVNALRQLTEQANQNAVQAMQDSAKLKNEMSAVRSASESASSDAAATRKLLKQMSDRIDGKSAQSTLK